jgi:hypothetical protein
VGIGVFVLGKKVYLRVSALEEELYCWTDADMEMRVLRQSSLVILVA